MGEPRHRQQLAADGDQTNGNPTGDDTATVFPDDQTGNAAEGTLTISFDNTNNSVDDVDVTLDVTADPDAGTTVSYRFCGTGDACHNLVTEGLGS